MARVRSSACLIDEAKREVVVGGERRVEVGVENIAEVAGRGMESTTLRAMRILVRMMLALKRPLLLMHTAMKVRVRTVLVHLQSPSVGLVRW
jgi:hypothetical protein